MSLVVVWDGFGFAKEHPGPGGSVLLQVGVSSTVVGVCGSLWLLSGDQAVVAAGLAAPWGLSCGLGCPLPPPCHHTGSAHPGLWLCCSSRGRCVPME